MKKLLLVIISFVTLSTINVEANNNIIALVNNEPVTLNEFRARKKMIMALNNAENVNAAQDKQLTELTIKSLIDEALLFQYSSGKEISQEEIESAIRSIEERNKMPKGYLIEYLKSKNVDICSFTAQIKSELIKMNILSGLSRSVNVSNKEIDDTILSSNKKDAEISMLVFESKDQSTKTLAQMNNLRKKLKVCANVKKSLYDNFATMIAANEKLSNKSPLMQTIIKDLSINQASAVFETNNKFQVILICNKKILNVTEDENNYVVNFLTNKKVSQKGQKFFDDMHKKAYIKILLPH